MLYRIGGDEFGIILKGDYTKKELGSLAEAIIEEVEKPINLEFYRFYLGISIGITSFPEDASTRKGINALWRYEYVSGQK